MFYHPELKLLLVVYVDDFKMSGPKDNMSKGWSLIASKLDMDTPGEVNRYLGCDHRVSYNVKLSVKDQPRKKFFVPGEEMVTSCNLSPFRFTNAIPYKGLKGSPTRSNNGTPSELDTTPLA